VLPKDEENFIVCHTGGVYDDECACSYEAQRRYEPASKRRTLRHRNKKSFAGASWIKQPQASYDSNIIYTQKRCAHSRNHISRL